MYMYTNNNRNTIDLKCNTQFKMVLYSIFLMAKELNHDFIIISTRQY